MNRETIIAILLGFAGGVLVAFLIITLPKKLSQNQQAEPTPVQQETVEETKETPIISINKPVATEVVETEETEVSGTTTANSILVISGPSQDQVVTSDAEGNFNTKLSVYEGENLIRVTLYRENEETVSQTLSVFASKENL